MADEAREGFESPTARSIAGARHLVAADLHQIERASDYLIDFNPRAAEKLAEGLIAAGDSLAHFPYRGRPVRGTDMRELVTAFPYIIRYRVVRDAVRILRVRHTSRRPTNP